MVDPISTTLPIGLFVLYKYLERRYRRTRTLPPTQERVLILGGSAGIGRSLAHEYTKRGARVCIVARRAAKVEEVKQECRGMRKGEDRGILGFVGDFTSVEDMLRVRTLIAQEWGGFDTLIVAAGVSSLAPLLTAVESDSVPKSTKTPGQAEEFDLSQSDRESIQRVVDVSAAATKGNYIGPLIAAETFIPMLTHTSKSPSILLVCWLANVIPTSSRAISATTKSAAMLLYQALAVEHRSIHFSLFMSSALQRDSWSNEDSASEQDLKEHAQKTEGAARRCIYAIDNKQGRAYLP